MPGSIDYDRKLVVDAHNLDYHDFSLGDLAGARYPGCLIHVENDANAAALAEYYAGAFRGCSSGLLITIGTGIGGGLVLTASSLSAGKRTALSLGTPRSYSAERSAPRA